MGCKWFMEQISAARIPTEAEIAEHMKTCPVCRNAFEGTTPRPDWSNPNEIKAELREIIKILERTKGAFKSKDVELARLRLEGLIDES